MGAADGDKVNQYVKSSFNTMRLKCSLAGPSDDEQKRVDRELTTLRQTSRRMREKNTQLRIEMKRLRKEKTDEESQSGRMKDRARETRKQRKKHSFDLAHYLIRKGAQFNKELNSINDERATVKKE